MPKNWSLPLGLRQGLFLSCLICHVVTSEWPELKCQTDFATEVVCHWDVSNATNCTQEFRLHYSINSGPKSACAIGNKRIPRSASSSCVCLIPETDFVGTTYTFSLETGRNLSRNSDMYLPNIVKPRPLRNLTVAKGTDSFILTWTKDYDPSHVLYATQARYEVCIAPEGEEHEYTKDVREQTDRYEIFASSLSPGKKYTARVRYRLVDWTNIWSDWSSPCEWKNDFETEGGDELGRLIPVVCFVVMAVISICYISLARLKRRWWDQVPSPAKSKLASELGKKPWLGMWKMFPGDEGKTPVCAFSRTLLERQLSFMDSLPDQWGTSSGQSKEVAKTVPGSPPRGPTEAFLTPEAPPIEPALMICGRVADTGPEVPMEREEDHIPHEGALADLFLDILGGGENTLDAEAPEPVPDRHPPASRATEQDLGDHLGLCGTTVPTKSPGGSSGSDYQNSGGAASARAVVLAPEQHRSISATQYKSLFFPLNPPSTPYQTIVADRIQPQADGQGKGAAATHQPSSYKSFSGLLGLPAGSVHQPWERQLGLSGVDRAQTHGGTWPSSTAALYPPSQQEAPSHNAPDTPFTVESPLSGYRPFRSVLPLSVASRDPGCLNSGSPYKPLLGVFSSIAKEVPLDPVLRIQEAEQRSWPWGEPPAFAFSLGMEEREGED